MKIDLSKFFDESISSITISDSLAVESIDYNGRIIAFVEPIVFDGSIYRVEHEKYVDITINYHYRESCGRCLDNFTGRNTIKLFGKLTNEVDDIEDETIYYDGEKIDLTDSILNNIVLDLPMKPICDEDCKGLCPICGENTNKVKCDCVEDKLDPRLLKLKDFFPND